MQQKKFALLYCLFIGILFLSCENSIFFSNKKTDIFVFKVSAFSRNKDIYLEWTMPTDFSYVSINIDYKENLDSLDFTSVELPINSSNYVISNLKNNFVYLVHFTAKDSFGKTYSKEMKCIPSLYEVKIDRQTAVIYDNKVHFSWVYSQANNYMDSIIYYKNQRLSKYYSEKFDTYEDVSEEIISPIETYNSYCTFIIDDFYIKDILNDGNEFEIRAINKNGVESDPIKIISKKVEIPIIEIYTKNLEPIKDKKNKIESKLSIYDNLDSANNLSNVSLTMKGRGNSSWTNAPKKSYTLKFDSKQNILGMKKHKSWALVANYFDKTLLRNVVAYQLGCDFYKNMEWSPTAKYVHLFINEIYNGIYTIVETNKIDENRIDIPNVEDCTETEEFSNFGFLIEANDRADESFNFKTNQGVVFSLKEPDGDDISTEIKDSIEKKVIEVEDCLYSDDFSDIESEHFYEKYLDSDSFIDWWIINELAKNPDSDFFSSCYMYFNPKDKKFYMGPLWDFDLGFGNINIDDGFDGWKTASKFWLQRLMSDPKFKEKAINRWNEKKSFLESYLTNYYNKHVEILNKEEELNFIRWPILGKQTWKNPASYENRVTYQSEVDYFKEWFENRIEWIDLNLVE